AGGGREGCLQREPEDVEQIRIRIVIGDVARVGAVERPRQVVVEQRPLDLQVEGAQILRADLPAVLSFYGVLVRVRGEALHDPIRTHRGRRIGKNGVAVEIKPQLLCARELLVPVVYAVQGDLEI